MIKEEYEKLKKKYASLPNFKDINAEFDLYKIEHQDQLLKKVIIRISEVLEKIIEHLESIIQPSPESFIQLFECKAFNEKEQEDIIDLFRKFMFSFRCLQEAELDAFKRVEIINKVFNEWINHKNKLILILQKQKECWEKSLEKDEILGYFG